MSKVNWTWFDRNKIEKQIGALRFDIAAVVGRIFLFYIFFYSQLSELFF